MGLAQQPSPVKLFLAIMHVSESSLQQSLKRCTEKFGTIEHSLGPVDFTSFTHYYNKEMGSTIFKSYMIFQQLIDRSEISSIKNFTNEIEKEFMCNNKRVVNLDPGYITVDKFVLASTKDFYHRIYLDQGIYAEVTLHFRRGRFRYFSWTYSDYKEEYIQMLLQQGRISLQKELNLST